MPLTAKAVFAPNISGKRERRNDGQGLSLLVSPRGSKRWELQYSFGGARRSLALGEFPAVSLAAARAAAAQARAVLDEGRDPQAPDPTKAAPVGPLFKTVVEAWFAHVSGGWTPAYASRVWARMRGDVLPALGETPVAAIAHDDVAAMLRGIETRPNGKTAPVMARRVGQHVEQIFAWHYRAEPGRANPAANARKDLKPRRRSEVKRRARLPLADLPLLFARLRDYEGDPATALALEFVIRTAVRTSEARFMVWPEVEQDLWRIPPDRMKMGGAEHLVPLAPGALALLKAAKALGRPGAYVFAGPRGAAMSQNTLIYALYRMGYHSRATTHGFRATFSSAANESGKWQPDWIETQLAHLERDDVRAAYNSALYLAQRRQMMTWWDTRVSEAKATAALL